MTASNDRARWFPYSYSRNKSDIIYMNQLLNCQDDYGCGTKDDCVHDPKWKIFNFEEYFSKEQYDYLSMGCSVSFGSEIKKSQTWRHNLPNSIDLSVPGMGIDAIWHNLRYLTSQDKVSFGKIIVLLPNLIRKTFRISRDGNWYNFIMTPNTQAPKHPNFSFKPEEMQELNERHTRFLVMDGQRYGTWILNKFIDWMNDSNLSNVYLSSWDNEVFGILEQRIENKERLLDQFDWNHMKDKSIDHPSPEAHQKWLGQIRKILV